MAELFMKSQIRLNPVRAFYRTHYGLHGVRVDFATIEMNSVLLSALILRLW